VSKLIDCLVKSIGQIQFVKVPTGAHAEGS